MLATTNINQTVGRQLRKLRISKGLSQKNVATGLNVSFQQVQKYEKGINRLTLEMLLKFLQILDTDLHTFLEFIEFMKQEETEDDADHIMTRSTYQLALNYHQIKNHAVQKKLANL